MTLDYFYGQAGELFSFFRIPKALFQEQRFQDLSTDAKTLYGILLDRMSLSVKNGWLDKQNRVFILFTIEDVKRALCCADNKATRLLRELEKFGLIERKRRGQGKPRLVYVKNFSAESLKEIIKNRDNDDSCGFRIACQDPAKSRCNKTKENDTELSETDPFYSEESDGMSKAEILDIGDPLCLTNLDYEEGTVGAWQEAESPAMTEEATAAFNEATEGFVGVDYVPVALLSTQTVAGTNYRILCEATTVYPGAEMHYAVVNVYESLEGNANIISATDGYVS